MTRVPRSWSRGRSRGQAMVEYGLILSLAIVVAAAGLILFSQAVTTMMSSITTNFLTYV